MNLVNYTLDRDLVLQVVDDLEDPTAGSVNAVLGTLQGDLEKRRLANYLSSIGKNLLGEHKSYLEQSFHLLYKPFC
jgi:hypothetical protein